MEKTDSNQQRQQQANLEFGFQSIYKKNSLKGYVYKEEKKKREEEGGGRKRGEGKKHGALSRAVIRYD